MDSSIQRETPIHMLSDSRRLLEAHNAWIAEWDGSNTAEEEEGEPLGFDDAVEKAFDLYCDGLYPIQVRRILAKEFSFLPDSQLRKAQRRAEKDLQAAEQAPPELRRAMVAACRAKAIQGALRDGEWGQAGKLLERAGLIAGELREGAGLSEEDLTLTYVIEGETPPLPEAGETEAAPQ